MRYSSGPRTEPCGTLERIETQFENHTNDKNLDINISQERGEHETSKGEFLAEEKMNIMQEHRHQEKSNTGRLWKQIYCDEYCDIKLANQGLERNTGSLLTRYTSNSVSPVIRGWTIYYFIFFKVGTLGIEI